MPALLRSLQTQLTPGGRVYLSGLVAETRRGRRYLQVLHRAGEVAPPRSAEELRPALGEPEAFRVSGCMAYATVAARPGGDDRARLGG